MKDRVSESCEPWRRCAFYAGPCLVLDTEPTRLSDLPTWFVRGGRDIPTITARCGSTQGKATT